MDKKIVIIGAGLAGTIAYNVLRQYKPIVLEARPETLNINMLDTHPAIMRLRDPQVAKYIGADCRRIKVSKGIYTNSIIKSNIQLNNLYSAKVYGELGKRSLNNLGEQERWLIEGYNPPDNIQWNRKVIKIDSKGIHTPGLEKWNYDICISTLPMPIMFDIVGAPPDVAETKFDCNPIYVLRAKLGISSSVHQTLYFPDPNTPVYRATIQKQTLIIEATKHKKNCTKHRLHYVMKAFGIKGCNIDYHANWEKMPIGKIKAIDENNRLRYIIWLTDRFNIFSFGRFAVWRPLRTDHLISDIEKIHRIIRAGDIQSRYKARLQ